MQLKSQKRYSVFGKDWSHNSLWRNPALDCSNGVFTCIAIASRWSCLSSLNSLKMKLLTGSENFQRQQAMGLITFQAFACCPSLASKFLEMKSTSSFPLTTCSSTLTEWRWTSWKSGSVQYSLEVVFRNSCGSMESNLSLLVASAALSLQQTKVKPEINGLNTK